MIPVKQTINDDKNGDCIRACIASILEKDIYEIPNFMKDGPGKYFYHLDKWKKKQPFTLIEFALPKTKRKFINNELHNCYVIGIIELEDQKLEHAVVCLNGKIVHDPAGNDFSMYKNIVSYIMFVNRFV